MSTVINNSGAHRFELPIEGSDGEIATAYYRIEDGHYVLTHTEVPSRFSGQGIGSQLAHGVFEAIRRDEGKVVLRCPFMGAYYARHPEYSDIVIG
ncbi:MAG: GNAT family N-acetyltransferase [Devosia indica]